MGQLEYVLRRKAGNRHLRLRINGDGAVMVIAPLALSEAKIKALLRTKISWMLKKREWLQRQDQQAVVPTLPGDFERHKREALVFVKRRLAMLNQAYGFKPRQITIKNLRSRWGSCSERGNITFHYRLLFLPQEIADYVIVHELCHLGELNHSRRFWRLVAKTFPRYQDLRRQLKRYRLTDRQAATILAGDKKMMLTT